MKRTLLFLVLGLGVLMGLSCTYVVCPTTPLANCSTDYWSDLVGAGFDPPASTPSYGYGVRLSRRVETTTMIEGLSWLMRPSSLRQPVKEQQRCLRRTTSGKRRI